MDSRMTFAERCLADYWACRNMLLQRYGREHFFDLSAVPIPRKENRVIPEKARRKLECLMERYVRAARKVECNIA